MTEASELYQRVVLDHNRAPRFYGAFSNSTHHSKGYNPICGDVVDVMVRVDGKLLSQLHFTCQACALCKASSSIMCATLQGQSLDEAGRLCEEFLGMLAGTAGSLSGDPGAFAAIKDFPARAKCVQLPWKTFLGAVAGNHSISTEVRGG